MKKLKVIVISLIVLLFGMPFMTLKPVMAQTGDKNITITGNIKIDFMDWDTSYKFNVLMVEKGNPDKNYQSEVTKENKKFTFNVQIPYGSSKTFEISQIMPDSSNVIKGMEYDNTVYNIILSVSDDGVITQEVNGKTSMINGDTVNIDQIKGMSSSFKNQYNSRISFYAGTSTTLKGGTWKKGTQLSYSFKEDFNATTGGSIWTQQDNLNHQDYTFGYNTQMNANETRILHYYIKKIDTNIRSVISDSKFYEVWFKLIDHGDGTNEKWHSFDGVDYQAGGVAPALFEDIFFRRTVEIEYFANKNDSEATFQLYEYTDGDASIDNTTKSLVGTYTTSAGKLTADIQEGKYFFIEKEVNESQLNTNEVYSFDVTRDNYNDKKIFQIGVKNPDIEEPEVIPNKPNDTITVINPNTDKSKENIVKTSDDESFLFGGLALVISFAGILYFGKKYILNN